MPPTKIAAVAGNDDDHLHRSHSHQQTNNGQHNSDNSEAKKVYRTMSDQQLWSISSFLFRLELRRVPRPVLVSEIDFCLFFPSKSLNRLILILVHLRNIDASELEIIQFGLPFGKIINLLNLRKKNQVRKKTNFPISTSIQFYFQAFLQFESIENAQAMTDYFSSVPILLNGRQIFVQFSNHQELKTDPNNANNQQAQIALQSATHLQEIARTGGHNCILRVIVSNMLYPVNVETFHQVSIEIIF